MSVTVEKDAVYLHDDGLIIQDAMLVLRDPAKHLPETGEAVWGVLETQDGHLCWELVEYLDGTSVLHPGTGWILVGTWSLLDRGDYTLKLWCHEPPLPRVDML